MAVHSCVARARPGAPQEVRHLNPLLCGHLGQGTQAWSKQQLHGWGATFPQHIDRP